MPGLQAAEGRFREIQIAGVEMKRAAIIVSLLLAGCGAALDKGRVTMHNSYSRLWNRIKERLDSSVPNWQERVEALNQISAVSSRENQNRFTDESVFKGLVLAVLSNSTDWAKVERVLDADIQTRFSGFDISKFAALKDIEIAELNEWFKSYRAGSLTLHNDLRRLRESALKLMSITTQFKSLDAYFCKVVEEAGSPTFAAASLGRIKSRTKLPGIGIPLAAEFLKNIGYDVAKPDRHINRAVGSFGWVEFRRWPNREATEAPIANEAELIAVMNAMEKFSAEVRQPVCYTDNVIWLLCAKSGAYQSNKALSALCCE